MYLKFCEIDEHLADKWISCQKYLLSHHGRKRGSFLFLKNKPEEYIDAN